MRTLALLLLTQLDAGSSKGPMMLETLFVMSAEKSPNIDQIAKRLGIEFRHDGPFSSAKTNTRFESVTFIIPSGSSGGDEPAHPGGTLDIAFTDSNRPTRAEIEKRFGASPELFYVRPCGSVKFSLKGDQVHFVRLGYSSAKRYPATR